MKTITLIMGLLLCISLGNSIAQDAPAMPRTAAPEGAEAYIQSPSDGAVVTSPFTVRFGLRNFSVAPATVQSPNTGHHHLLVDVTEMPTFNLPLPTTENVLHYGLGQTETELELPPGEHTLQLVLGDWLHTPHQPPIISEVVTITVSE
ncbi:MAG: DUF4399 domain-containing protein [Candidatus Rariloculaceae bacterium]